MPISILATLTGTAGNDTLTGGAAADSLSGLGGNDRLLGNGGNDTLLGATGADTLDGGFGADRAEGGDGADSILGAGGNDTLKGGVGADTLKGGTGFDVAVFAGNYADYSFGQAGGYLTVIDREVNNGDEGTDRLIGVERLQFADREVSVGSENRVNASIDGEDGNAAVTVLSNGGFVVAWQRSTGDSTGELHFQRYADDWRAIGSEVVWSQGIADDGELAIDALAGGGFVITWDAFESSTFQHSVRAQRFDASGGSVGVEIAVAALGSNAPAGIDVAGTPSGGFVISWGEARGLNGLDVMARRYSAQGAAQGAAFTANTTTTQDQLAPSIDVFVNGSFIVAWESVIEVANGFDIRAQRFSAAGAPLGVEFHVNDSYTFGPQQHAAVATLDDGGFVIAWDGQGIGDGSGIFAQRFDMAANAVGGAFRVNDAGFDIKAYPSVGALTGGGFVIAWESGSNYSTAARRYGPDGDALGQQILLNETTSGIHTGTDVAGLPGGSFVAVWQGAGVGDGSGVYSAVYDMAGIAQGGASATVKGTDENDVLDLSGPGGGYAAGLGGNDLYIVDEPLDIVFEQPEEGYDGIRSSTSYVLPRHFEFLELVGTDDIDGTGNDLPNELYGNSGDNVLDGLGGVDTLVGGAGDDTYFLVEDGGTLDTVREEPGGGHDRVVVEMQGLATIPNNVEDMDITGDTVGAFGNASANRLRGNELENTMEGFAGNDTLDGGIGGDDMFGGSGDDVYFVDNIEYDMYESFYIGDVVTELDGEGIDTIFAAVDFDLPANVEGIGLVGTAVAATGNGLANLMIGNAVQNELLGGFGNDTLDGGAGADRLEGGSGDDFYLVDDTNDLAFEAAGEGNDWVQSLISYILGANLERLQLVGTADLSGFGNALDNWMEGNSGNNTLDGGAGADRMLGGDGDDTYYVDSAGDEVIEEAAAAALIPIGGEPDPSGSGSNIDTVIAQVSYTLRSNVENLQLAGSSNLSGNGNGLDNLISGNSGNNKLLGKDGADVLDGDAGNDSLDGGTGKDTLGGGAGNDTLVGGAGDTLLEAANQGTDTVKTALAWTLANNFENLLLTGSSNLKGTGNSVANTLTGSSGANTLSGLGGNDKLLGSGGNDTLAGGTGNDTLTGGAGADVFLFDTALAANKDTITDFAIGSDKIRLDDDVFKAFDASTATTLGSGQFRSGPQATAAQDADDRIVYNSTTGALYYDADGLGGATAVQFAIMGTAPALTAADFRIGD